MKNEKSLLCATCWPLRFACFSHFRFSSCALICLAKQPIRVISLSDGLCRRFNMLNRPKSRQGLTGANSAGQKVGQQTLTDGPTLANHKTPYLARWDIKSFQCTPGSPTWVPGKPGQSPKPPGKPLQEGVQETSWLDVDPPLCNWKWGERVSKQTSDCFSYSSPTC